MPMQHFHDDWVYIIGCVIVPVVLWRLKENFFGYMMLKIDARYKVYSKCEFIPIFFNSKTIGQDFMMLSLGIYLSLFRIFFDGIRYSLVLEYADASFVQLAFLILLVLISSYVFMMNADNENDNSNLMVTIAGSKRVHFNDLITLRINIIGLGTYMLTSFYAIKFYLESS